MSPKRAESYHVIEIAASRMAAVIKLKEAAPALP